VCLPLAYPLREDVPVDPRHGWRLGQACTLRSRGDVAMPRTVRSLFADVLALTIGFVIATCSTTVLAAARHDSGMFVPSVWLLSPSSGQAVNGTVTVSATASQDTIALQFQLNGTNLGPAISSGACSMSWNTGAVGDGPYAVTVVAYDANGGTATSSPANVTVENTLPVISNVSASGITSTSAIISWVTNQPTSSGVDYGPSTYTNSTPLDVTLTTQHAETIIGLAPGTLYHFRATSWNGVGALATSPDFIFTTGSSTSAPSSSTPSNPESPPATVYPGGCTTPDPFVAMGGGTCVNGAWLPPGMTPVSSSTSSSSTPPTTSSGCLTPDPFTAIGGGTCVNGGWLPRAIASPPAPQTPSAPPAAPPVSTPNYGGCGTADPFVALGGGTCLNGGWYPPGMLPAPGTIIVVQPPAATTPGGCVTPDPFVGIAGLHGACVNGGWYPVHGGH
jgi:hypothetical protein